MLLLGLSDSPGDQVSSYKGIPPSASPNEKNSVMVGLALPIRHRSEDPQGCQKPSHNRFASPIPRRKRVFTKRRDPQRGDCGRTPRKEVDHEV